MSAVKQAYWRFMKRVELWREKADLRWLDVANRMRRRPVVGDGAAVVSLTSYGARTGTAYLTIESIGRGALRPRRLILWLDDLSVVHNPPPNLARLKARGLEILHCDDLGPHKKYYPYVEGTAALELPLVTADDDVIYPHTWLERLVQEHRRTPGDVICYRAREIHFANGALATYNSWPLCKSTTPSVRFIATGVSGVLYPPALQQFLKAAGRQFVHCCPRADDLWLHVNAVRNGCRIRQIHALPSYFPELPNTQDQALCITNADGGQNDVQIGKTYTQGDIAALLAG